MSASPRPTAWGFADRPRRTFRRVANSPRASPWTGRARGWYVRAGVARDEPPDAGPGHAVGYTAGSSDWSVASQRVVTVDPLSVSSDSETWRISMPVLAS